MSEVHVHSSIQIYSLLKSCVIIFVVQAVIVFFSPPTLLADPWRFIVLGLNLVIAVVLGWYLYKYRYHLVFTYDDEGFALKKGKGEEVKHKWKDFSKVSLFRTEYGELAVRLYMNEEFFDLPMSKLKLNSFDFRLKAMRFVSSSKSK